MSAIPTAAPESPTDSIVASKIAVVSALLFALAMFLTVATVNVPHDASDAELLDWWSTQSNRTSGVVSSLFALGAAALLVILVNHVVELHAARRSPHWRAFSRSMATVFCAAMLVTATTRSAVSHSVDVMDGPLPGVDVLRYATALNYRVIGFAAMGALALTILALSVLALRTEAFGRWAAYVGLVCGAVMVGAVSVGYGAYTVPLAIVWSVCTGIALRPRA